MSESVKPSASLSPTALAARDLVRGHLDPETFGKDAKVDLATLQAFESWLVNPAGSLNLQHIPVPEGTAVLVMSSPYHKGDLLTQRPATPGKLPAFMYPLPGQPCRVIGSPEGFKVPDGCLWDEEAQRWACEDTRVLVNTPSGVTVFTLDAEALVPWTALSPVDPTQEEALVLVRSMISHIQTLEVKVTAPEFKKGDLVSRVGDGDVWEVLEDAQGFGSVRVRCLQNGEDSAFTLGKEEAFLSDRLELLPRADKEGAGRDEV